MYCVHPAKGIAPIDAVKGVNMFKKVDVPVCPSPPLVSSRYMVCTQFTGADTRNGPKYECMYLHILTASTLSTSFAPKESPASAKRTVLKFWVIYHLMLAYVRARTSDANSGSERRTTYGCVQNHS
jgi:hypothetical protein